MGEVCVSAVRTRRDRRDFFQLPWRLYADDPNWVPPMRDHLKQLLGWKPHPFHQIAEVEHFVARRGSRTVGRVTAIVNHRHNQVYHERRGFFGFFECENDPEAAHRLFDAAATWLAQRGMEHLRGPVNPSMNYECALLIEGFDRPPVFMMTYNPPYYAELIESYGFRKTHDLLAYIGHIEQLPEVQQRLNPLVEQAKERAGVHLRPMNPHRLLDEARLFLETYNRACQNMWGFVPLTEGEVRVLAANLKHLLVPELALAAVTEEGQTVGVVLGLPDYNPVIKQINGRLFPFGFLKILRARKHIHRIRVVSINVIPEYQRWGVGLVLLSGLAPKALEAGVKEAEFSWVSETNDLARLGLEKGGARLYKRYRIYDLDLRNRPSAD